MNVNTKGMILAFSLLGLLGAGFFLPPASQAQPMKPTAFGDPNAKKGGTIYHRIGTYPRKINAWLSGDVYAAAISSLTVEAMIEKDEETWDDIPGVAKDWSVSKDKLSAVFKLDPRAKWWDGKPITADDIVFTFDTIFDKKNDLAPSRAFLDAVKSWKKIDKRTVSFAFKRVHFQNISRVGGVGIMKKSFFSKGNFNKDFNNAVVGSGPYIFDKKKSKKGKKIVLNRNKKWWRKDDPEVKNKYNFDKVIFTVIKDDRVAFESFKKGDLSFFYFAADGLNIWAKELNTKEFSSGKLVKLEYPRAYPSSWGGVALNMRRGPTADLPFRKALQALFNPHHYTKKIFDNLQVPLRGPFGNFSDYASPKLKATRFDATAAKKLLKEAGYAKVDNDGVLYKTVKGKKQRAEITIMFAYLPHEKYLTIWKEDAGKAGVKLNLKFTEWAAASKLVDDWKFDAFVMGWGGGPIPSPSQLWHGKFADEKASSNIPGFKDPEVDKLIETAPAEFDKAKRLPLFHKIEEGIVKAQPYIWRWQQKAHYVAFNPKMMKKPKSIPKYTGNHTQGLLWISWWHPEAK